MPIAGLKGWLNSPMGRTWAGINTFGVSELARPGGGALGGLARDMDPTNNEFREVNRDNFNLPGFANRDAYTMGAAQGAQGRQAFQAADSPWGQDQRTAAEFFRKQMLGEGGSIAMQQIQEEKANNIAQQRSLMASAGPSNSAMMARVGSQNIGRLNQQASGQGMLGALMERQAAAGTYANMANTARAQDQNMSQFNAGMQAQNRAANDAYEMGMLGMNQQNAALQQSGGMGYEQQRGNRFAAVSQVPSWQERLMGMYQQAAPVIGSAISDERAKTNVKDGGAAADNFLNSLAAKSYDYVAGAFAGGGTAPQTGTDEKAARAKLAPQPGAENMTNAGYQDAYSRASAPPPPTPGQKAVASEWQSYHTSPMGGVDEQELAAVNRANKPQHLGVMAQDVQATPMGQGAVVQRPQDGMRVITPSVTGPVLAGLARLNERLNRIEGKTSRPQAVSGGPGSGR